MSEKPITSRLTAKGQTTIPVEVRDMLGLEPGDTIRFVIADGVAEIIARNRSAESMFGQLAAHARQGTEVDDYRDAVDGLFSVPDGAASDDEAA